MDDVKSHEFIYLFIFNPDAFLHVLEEYVGVATLWLGLRSKHKIWSQPLVARYVTESDGVI